MLQVKALVPAQALASWLACLCHQHKGAVWESAAPHGAATLHGDHIQACIKHSDTNAMQNWCSKSARNQPVARISLSRQTQCKDHADICLALLLAERNLGTASCPKSGCVLQHVISLPRLTGLCQCCLILSRGRRMQLRWCCRGC